MRVTYDRSVDAAYIYLADPIEPGGAAFTYACDPNEVGGMIHLDFSDTGRLLGIEVLAASKLLPGDLLDRAEE